MELHEKKRILQEAYDHCLRSGKVKNKNDFAVLLGTSRTSLSSAFNGNEMYLTDKLIARVVELAGAPEAPAENTVPLVPFTVRGGTLQDHCDGATVWDCEPIISPVKGAELAFEVSGDSMAPAFPPGARVLLKKVRSDIMWGEIYVVDTEDGAVLKRVFPTDDEGVLELRSDNPAYPPVKMPTAHVRGVWRVLLRMIQ